MNTIGSFMAQVRERAGLTQAEVGTLRKASRGAQSQLELSSANPRWSTVEEFAQAIGARVTLRFDLFNGASAEFVTGLTAPNLLDTLEKERDQLRRDERYESAVAAQIAAVVEPSGWARQGAIRVLIGAAIGANLHGEPRFIHDFDLGHWEDEAGNWTTSGEVFVDDQIGVIELNRVVLQRLFEQVARQVTAIDEGREGLFLCVTPTPAFELYSRDGAPGARSVADQLSAIAQDVALIDQLLAAIGFLPSGPQSPERNHDGRE